MSDAVLRVHDLSRTYGGAAAVNGVSFELYRGEVLALLGPSGCGKSTTLRMVAGLEAPDGGAIEIRGKVVASATPRIMVPAEKRNLGLVFQNYAIWPHLTVEQNVAYPLEIRRVPRQATRQKVAEALALVGLSGFGQRPATALSGGQQQRVALARALVYEPDILLLDEPLSNLDAKLRAEMRFQLKSLQQRLKTTVLYVTHDQMEAMSLADRVAVMRNGKIEQIGVPTEIYEAPSNFFVQSFVGRVVTLPGTALPQHGAAALLAAAQPTGDGASTNGTPLRLAVRPEDVHIEPAGAIGTAESPDGLRGELKNILYCGDHLECVLRVGDAELVVDAEKDAPLQLGQEVVLQFKPHRVRAWAE